MVIALPRKREKNFTREIIPHFATGQEKTRQTKSNQKNNQRRNNEIA